MVNNQNEKINKLVQVIAQLRAPNGCPWDREQTHKTLRENFLQETYEAIDAIDSENIVEFKEELGDVLLQIVLHSQIASESGKFNFYDVVDGITDKIIRRHPHVFSDLSVECSDEVMKNWEIIKKNEKPERKSALSGISKSQPALMTALQLSKKAVKVGFEWPNEDLLWECFYSEIQEFKQAVSQENQNHIEDELGDVLFSLVNIARWNKVDPELALIRANKKFMQRFQKMEEISSKKLSECNIQELDDLWKTAKNILNEK